MIRYGPATTAHIMTQALAEGFIDNPILENIVSYVAQDCTIYVQDVVKLCTENVTSRRRCSIVKRDARTRASLSCISSQARDFDLAHMAMQAEAMTGDMIVAEDEEDDMTISGNTSRQRSRSHSHDYSLCGDDVANGSNSDFDDCDVFADLEADILPQIQRSNLSANRASSTFNLYGGGGGGETATSTGTSGYASMSSHHAHDPAILLNHPVSHQPKTTTCKSSAPSSSSSSASSEKWRGIVIYIPVRLGGEKFNPVYTECIKSLFAHPCTLGIIGGRPKHSLYFIGNCSYAISKSMF